MIEVVDLVDGEHGAALRRTLRSRFSCSVDDVGGSISWLDLVAFIEGAAGDTSSEFGAALAGWGYPASILDVGHFLMTAATGNKKLMRVAQGLTPWAVGERQRAAVRYSQEEIEAAQAEMWDDVVFTA